MAFISVMVDLMCMEVMGGSHGSSNVGMTTLLHFHHKWALLGPCLLISNNAKNAKVLRISVASKFT